MRAGAIIALQEAIVEAPTFAAAGGAEAGVAVGAQRGARRWPWTRWIPDVGLAIIGLGAGLSPLFSGYYSLGVWIVLGLVLVVAAATALVARPLRPTWPMDAVLRRARRDRAVVVAIDGLERRRRTGRRQRESLARLRRLLLLSVILLSAAAGHGRCSARPARG